MSTALSIGLSGLTAAQLRLDSSAHNVANAQTPGFRRQQVVQQAVAPQGGVQATISPERPPGVSLEAEAVEQMSASYHYKANLRTVQVQDEVMGALLDIRA